MILKALLLSVYFLCLFHKCLPVSNLLVKRRFLVTITLIPSKLLEVKVCGDWLSTFCYCLLCSTSNVALLALPDWVRSVITDSLKIRLLPGSKLAKDQLLLFSMLGI